MSSTKKQLLHEMKQNAVNYYEQNGVPKRIEAVLNSMFYENPSDIYGYLSTYFETLALQPSLSNITFCRSLSSFGLDSYVLQIEVLYKNQKRTLGKCYGTILAQFPENGKVEDQQLTYDFFASQINEVEKIVPRICLTLVGSDILRQRQTDFLLRELAKCVTEEFTKESNEEDRSAASSPLEKPASRSGSRHKSPTQKGKKSFTEIPRDEPPQPKPPGLNCLSAVSLAVFKTGAALRNLTTWQYMAELHTTYACSPVPSFYEKCLYIPLPICTIFRNGRGYPGKFNAFKELSIMPRNDMDVSEAIEAIGKIYREARKNASVKGGIFSRNVDDSGCIVSTWEKLETPMEQLSDAVAKANYELGVDFFVCINAAAQEIFEPDKGRYDFVSGAQKHGMLEESPSFWLDVLQKYPYIMGLIDPFRRVDANQWKKLAEETAEMKTMLIAKDAFHEPYLLKGELISEITNVDDSSGDTAQKVESDKNPGSESIGDMADVEPHPGLNSDVVPNPDANAYFLSPVGPNTVSDLIEVFDAATARELLCIVGSHQYELEPETVSDLAVGLQSPYVYFSGLSCSAGLYKLQLCHQILNAIVENISFYRK